MRRIRWTPIALFLVALGVRVAYALLAHGRDATPSSDAASYDTVAWHLARGTGFALDGAAGPYATAFVPPIVPWLTSLVYRAVGHDFFAAILLQCVLGAAVAPWLAAFAGAAFGPGPARFAGWFVAFHPLLVFFSGWLLTETAFSLAVLLAAFASAEWVKTPRPGRAFGAGLLWGLAALTRPTALPLPLLVAAWSWWPLGLTIGGRDRVRQVSLLLLGVVLAVAPWTMRNAIVLDAFVPVTTGGGRSLLDANNPIVWDDPARRGGATSVYHLEPYASRFRGKSEAQIDAESGRLARAFLRERAADFPRQALAKLARFWRWTSEGGGTGTLQRPGSALAGVGRVADPLLWWSLIVWPLALWGLARTLQGPRRLFQSLPALLVLAFTLGAIVYWGALRMRVPAEPMIALYAACGLDDLRLRWRLRRSRLELVER